MVCFEKAEDAKKLLSIKSVDVKGIRVLAVRKTVSHFLSLFILSESVHKHLYAVVSLVK